VSFAAITLFVASQRLFTFVIVYIVCGRDENLFSLGDLFGLFRGDDGSESHAK
jgi:hypothetical protein